EVGPVEQRAGVAQPGHVAVADAVEGEVVAARRGEVARLRPPSEVQRAVRVHVGGAGVLRERAPEEPRVAEAPPLTNEPADLLRSGGRGSGALREAEDGGPADRPGAEPLGPLHLQAYAGRVA